MPMSRLSWLPALSCPRACTSPPVPLSVPMRADDSGSATFDWKISVAPALIVTGFARNAVGAACALLLKRNVPAFTVSRPSQVLLDGPVAGLTNGVPNRKMPGPFFTISAIPETA